MSAPRLPQQTSRYREVSDTAVCRAALQVAGGCSAGSNVNGLRELACSHAGTEIWYPGTFLENSINVIKYALKLASQQKKWNFVMLGIEECVLTADLEDCRYSTSLR